MPKREKGSSHSIRPVSKRPPVWCRYQPEEVEALIVKLGKEGHNSSRIGTILRDQHGIPLVKPIVGKSISQVLKDAGSAPPIPEDLEALLKKATHLHAHLEKDKKDLHNQRSLQITEAKIHRLVRYYKRRGVLPEDWRYDVKTTSLI